MQESKMLTGNGVVNERDEFNKVFKILANDIVNDIEQYNLPKEGKAWIKNMMEYTVPGGKMNRGLTVLSALRSLAKFMGKELTEQDVLKANVLGWSVEWLQAVFLVADDIMDGSITRRGQPCWYKQENVGMIAINDSFILKSCIYRLLKKYFREEPYYLDLIELLNEVAFKTELGQLMDLITAPEDHVDLNKFSIEKHAYIVEYKTAYYSFYLPIAFAMRMAGITDSRAYQQANDFLIPLGEYFQIQDDFLDCYGDPKVIGKIGTDIQDNKCSWLINQALALANPKQLEILTENYGQKDAAKEALVKQVFNELNLKKVFMDYEEASYQRLHKLLENVDEKLLPREMFVVFMNRIYKRTK